MQFMVKKVIKFFIKKKNQRWTSSFLTEPVHVFFFFFLAFIHPHTLNTASHKQANVKYIYQMGINICSVHLCEPVAGECFCCED